MKSKLYVITGVMAAGKSTVAELLASKFDKSVHIRGDAFRKMIVKGGADMSDNPSDEALSQLDLRYNITADVAKKYLEAGFTVIMQDNYLGDKLSYILELLSPNEANVVVLYPNVETIKKRELSRNKKGYIGFNVEDMYNMFSDTTPKIGFWIDTSDLTPEETVQKIIQHYQIKN